MRRGGPDDTGAGAHGNITTAKQKTTQLGFGSVSKEQMDSNTLLMVNAGDHWSFKMSKQMLP